MIVQVSDELSGTMTVRRYAFDLSQYFANLVFKDSSGSKPSLRNSYRLRYLCESVRRVSKGRFHTVELSTGGLTCFIAGSDDDFDDLDNEVYKLIIFAFGTPLHEIN